MKHNISLRPADERDREFLEKIYFETRRAEFAAAGLDEFQLNALLKMQFDMQIAAYKMQFPEAESYVIECGGERAGRLIVERGAAEIRLIDIAVLQEFRGRGIGGVLLEDLQSETEKAGKTLTLKVLKTNEKAIRLYERSGFIIAANNETHLMMRWESAKKIKQKQTNVENNRL